MSLSERYEAVIGLEVHAELLTRSKMFNGAPVVDSVSASPNSAVTPLCLGMPGTLPVINRRAVEMAIRVALALNCRINLHNRFARKNYFYPDLAKGYQISQYDEPLAVDGWLDVELASGATRRVRVRRVHMEEDPGKLTHSGDGYSLIDYNRSGVPLLEIVSEPDMRSAEEAQAYAVKLRRILRYLGVNSGDMEKGVLRIEPNISIRKPGSERLNTRTEVKNLNSFRALQQATQYEIERQAALRTQGKPLQQQTRGWDEAQRRTFKQRSKEDAHDYRYFPDPDLPALLLDPAWIEQLQRGLPELPDAKLPRYLEQFELSAYDSELLIEEPAVAAWFERAVALGGTPKTIANLLLNNLFSLMRESGQAIDEMQVTPAALVELVTLVENRVINSNIAKSVLVAMFESGLGAKAIVERDKLAQVSDESVIADCVRQIMSANPDEVAAYRDGKTKLRGFFVGQVMRQMKGKANPRLVNAILDAQLGGDN